jgi:NAD(P)-dependent dehydrogenase (short-subunit alcohol dehydrogenase family)
MTTPTVWITGASSGIGQALSLLYAASGYTVCISSRNVAALTDMAGKHANIHAYPLDVTNATDTEAAVQRMVTEHGTLTLAILNAGTYYPTPYIDFDIPQYEQLHQTNVMGVLYGIAALKKYGQPKRIGIVSSVAGITGLPNAACYGATKAALVNMIEAWQGENPHLFTLIMPGFVKTPLTDKNTFPMPFLWDAERAARVIKQGLDKGKPRIIFPWPLVMMLRLLSILPERLRIFIGQQFIV